MATFNVFTERPPIKHINSIIEGVATPEEAIAQFRKARNLDEWEAKHEGQKLEITAQLLNQPGPEVPEPVTKVASPHEGAGAQPDVSPAPADLPKPDEVEASAEDEVEAPRSVGLLKPFGVSDNDVADLRDAGLTTVEAVVAYAKEHGGLKSIGGIGVVGEGNIKKAIHALG